MSLIPGVIEDNSLICSKVKMGKIWSDFIKIIFWGTLCILLFWGKNIEAKTIENPQAESYYFEYRNGLFTLEAHKVQVVHFLKILEATLNIEIVYGNGDFADKIISYQASKKSKDLLIKDVLNKLQFENYMLVFNEKLYKLYLIKGKTGHEKEIFALIQDLSNQNEREKALKKLKAIGANSLSVLKDIFTSSNDSTKENILNLINSIDDSGVKEILSIALEDRNKFIRKKSLDILAKKAKRGYFTKDEIKQLGLPLLNDQSDFIKGEAALFLSGERINEAIMPIIASLKKTVNTDPDVRENTDLPESHSMRKAETLIFYYIDALLEQREETTPILNTIYNTEGAKKDNYKNDYKYVLAYILDRAGKKIDVNTLIDGLTYCAVGRIRAGFAHRLGERKDHIAIKSLTDALLDNYQIKTKEGAIYPVRNNAREALEKITSKHNQIWGKENVYV